MNDPRENPGGRARGRAGGPPSPRGTSQNSLRAGHGHAATRGRRGRSSRRAVKSVRRRRALRTTGIVASAVLLVAAGSGAWLYHHLNGNINSVSIEGGGKEKADSFGRTPINLLVIGADARDSAADCKLGGACSQVAGQGHADVEMVVHISADRSNATVMSIPRDTLVHVPACTDPKGGKSTQGFDGMVNSALAYGPSCQVETVHQLTGVPIDHFLMVDFSGVVNMSDAVGGVPVCVNDDVYDTESHLKLSKGTHTLKGKGALEFVRTRYGFGDGGDRGRAAAQHMYLGSMIRKFHSARTLADPTKVYPLVNAATKALTVDDGLNSIKKLGGLATDVNKVPAKRITFTTMQTDVDPNNQARLRVGSGAKDLFHRITADQPLTGSSAAKGGSTGSTGSGGSSGSTVPAARVSVSVRNGTGVGGRASVVSDALAAKGFDQGTTTTGNAPAPASTTTLDYGPGQSAEARTAAKALGLPASRLTQGPGSGLTLVIGSDWPSGSAYPGGAAGASNAHSALSDSDSQTADQSGACAKVSTYNTVNLNGVPMTPTRAYANSRDVPNSAP